MEIRKMKIGLVLPSVPSYSETFFNNKIKGLEEQGYTVVLLVNSNKHKNQFASKTKGLPDLYGNNFRALINHFICLFQSFFFHFKRTKRLYLLNRKDGMSIAHCLKSIIISSHIISENLDWVHFGFGTLTFNRENVAQAIGAQMAVSFRGYDHYVYPLKHKDCYKILFKKELKFHVLSEGMKTELFQNGISNKQIVKITPAIDTSLFFEKETTRSNSVLNIVTIARLHWIKGLDATLEALALLKQKGFLFRYTIVGDGKEKERLQFAVHQLGLVEDVFFAGKLSPEAVKETLKSTDIYVQYSIQEGFCNAVLEAQAMGKLCIVSDAEGLSENVLDKVTGFVVPKRNPISLANKIAEVYKMSIAEKHSMTQNAIARVESEFTLSKQIEKFIAFYESH